MSEFTESFGLLFKPVTKDMGGNLNNLTKAFFDDEKGYEYLDEFLLETVKVTNVTSSSLFWLTRLLELLERFLTNVLEDETCDDNLKDCLKKAYKATLEKHHNFIVREMFSLAYRLIPSRKELFGSDDKYNENMKALKVYLPSARDNINGANNILNNIK